MITAEVEARDNVARNNADLANQINPDLAGGVFLDAIWSLTAGGRIAATRSTLQGVVLTGQAGTVIRSGARASVAQKDQTRLRDHLATSDLRLSVLLATPGGGGGMPATNGTGSVVHGAARGELDPEAAQRIVAITGDGDEGLKALQACQAYARELVQRGGKSRSY